MIEIKPIRRIQKEYLELLLKNLTLINNPNASAPQLAYFFEEISLFWLRRYEIINLFLNKLETDDKVSFLAGAMYIDLKGFGHYEFAICGKHHIFTDPVTKLRPFFSRNAEGVNKDRVKEYLRKVVFDCVDVLSNYSDIFMVLPLDDITLKDKEERIKFLKESSFSFISSLFINSCPTEHEFITKYHSIEQIEQDIRPEVLNKLIFKDRDDISLCLKDRIEHGLDDAISIASLRERMVEAEVFLMAVGQFFMQAIDILLIAYSNKMIPFVRSDVVLNYILLIYPTFEDEASLVKLLEQMTTAYIFTKVYGKKNFSEINFMDFYENVRDNNIIDKVIEKSRSKGEQVFDLSVNELASILKDECSVFL